MIEQGLPQVLALHCTAQPMAVGQHCVQRKYAQPPAEAAKLCASWKPLRMVSMVVAAAASACRAPGPPLAVCAGRGRQRSWLPGHGLSSLGQPLNCNPEAARQLV